MALEQEIESIRTGIRRGGYPNEASVSQGIVLRLLNALGWPTFDTQIVWPEYTLSGRRVDFCLCHPPTRPIAFVEVKQIGLSDGAERQLFEYAFHDGVPLAILTDGREWNFFLPGEQGDYGERRVYKLDIVDRDVTECVERLQRYLQYGRVATGEALQAARDDYRNVSRERQMVATLPKAWAQIIAEEDDTLLEIVADRVETLCGYKPGPDMISAFLKSSIAGRAGPVVTSNRSTPAVARAAPSPVATPSFAKPSVGVPAQSPMSMAIEPPPATIPAPDLPPRRTVASVTPIGFTFMGVFHPARNAIDTMRQVFEALSKHDPTFAERFAALPKHGRTRRYLATDPTELYPGRPDLVRDSSIELPSGYWLSTNHSRTSIMRIIEMACEVARVDPTHDLVLQLGE